MNELYNAHRILNLALVTLVTHATYEWIFIIEIQGTNSVTI